MRVLQLIDSLNVGGAERMAVNMANALEPIIDTSFLCVTRKEGALRENLDNKVNYLFLNKKSSLDIKALLKLRSFITNNQIDVIHAHSTSFFYGTLMKIVCLKSKLLWHDHHGNRAHTGFFKKIILKVCSLYFDQIVCVNEELTQWSEKHLYCKQIDMVFNFPINFPRLSNPKLKGTDGQRILCLANLRSPKNHMLLLKSFQLVHQVYPDWTLHCVGQIYEDEYSNKVLSAVKEMELDHVVYFYGLRTDISDIISACDIGVLSSTTEGLPMALLEYGLGGLAIVSTDVGDSNKIVIDSSMGILVPSNNEKALSEGVLFYIEHPEELYKAGRKLQSSIEQNFSKDLIVRRFINIYKNLKGL